MTKNAGQTPENVRVNEAEMMRDIARRDPHAFTAFYDLYAPAVFAFLTRLLKNPNDAEEILQETFWQAWRQAAGYDPARGVAVAWLISIARSRGIDRLRKTHRERQSDAGSVETMAESLPAKGDFTLEAREVIGKALSGLPVEQKTPILLAFFDGLTQEEIANHLATPLGTVKTRIRLGMKKLYETLEKIKAEL